jgi:subtilisin family serine protease
MAALITRDLRQVLDARNPSLVDVLLEADPGQGQAVRNALDDLGLDYTSATVGRKAVFEATVTPGQIDSLRQVEEVAKIDHSPTFSPTGAAAPNPPGRREARTQDGYRQVSLKSVTTALGFPEAWEAHGTRGEGVRIGMVDTPIDPEHPTFEGVIGGTAGPRVPELHGTWVASAMVGNEYETTQGTIRGGAPEATLYAHGALANGGATVTEIAQGIDYLLSEDVDVINLSLGGQHSDVLHSVVQEATDEGALVVTSAGNSGPGSGTISCPAHHQESLAVGAVSTSERIAAFSSRGPGWKDAPQKPDVVAYGGGARLGGDGLELTESILGAAPNGDAQYLVGTSMAAPQVAALAALRESAQREGR